jgi:CubicO group peptidase (beta-lactamase class C family)
VAKPVISALIGIAIAQGRIGSVDDPVTRYLPELARRDPRFGRITLRHLLTMSSGLADLDPCYDLDYEPWPCATPGSRGPPAAGSTTTTSTRSCWAWCWSGLPERRSRPTWPNSCGGRWAWRPTAPGAWTAATRGWSYSTRADTRTDPSPRFGYDWWTRPGSGPANDFWAQGNHGQFVYVSPCRNVVLVRFGTDYNYDHWPDLLAGLARRL